MNTKKWYRSKTLWSNLIGFVAVMVSIFLEDKVLASKILAAEASLLTFVNIVLRITTNTGLES